MKQGKRAEKSSAMNQLLKNMDKSVVDSFSAKQLQGLRRAVNDRAWRKHSVDIRPTLALPFLPWNFYLVFLFGVNRRTLTSAEQFIASAMLLSVVFLLGLTVIGFVFLVLYLLKSALGIDLFPNESLGIWDEFKNIF